MQFVKRLWNWGRRHRRVPEILKPAETVNRVLIQERKRIDRRGGVVSLVTFEIPAEDESARLERVAGVLRRRLRETDVAGLLERRRIGLVLPDTGRAGAETLVADIRAACGYSPAELRHEVIEYCQRPDDEFGDNGRREPVEPMRGSLADAATPGQAVEAIFCAPVPRWKRGMDVAGALFALLVVWPVIAGAVVLVKLTSPGPSVFVQNREGRGGRVFRMYKLRTMYVGADQDQAKLIPLSEQDGPAFKMKNDPRLTKIGKFLRKTSIDELPQLFNVLKGDMSLVGPRPLPYRESARCEPWQRQRLQVNPGITCIWQARARSSVSFVEWIRMDLQYVREMSPVLDLKLLCVTVLMVLFQRGAH